MKGRTLFANRKTSDPSDLDMAIANAHLELSQTSIFEEDYATIMAHLTSLYRLKELEPKSEIFGVSKDTCAIIAGNLLGIGLILSHERAHVITTKALSFVSKLK